MKYVKLYPNEVDIDAFKNVNEFSYKGENLKMKYLGQSFHEKDCPLYSIDIDNVDVNDLFKSIIVNGLNSLTFNKYEQCSKLK